MSESIADLINRRIDGSARQNINTCLPAVVTNVDNLTTQQTIDCTPLINRVYEDGVVMQPTNVFDIPVVFQTGGGGILSFPISIGDTVLLVYSMRSIDEWLDSDGTNQTPKDNRHHHRTDAIAIPGIYTKSTSLAPSATDVEIKFKKMNIIMKPDNTMILDNDEVSMTMTPSGDLNIVASGNINMTAANINLN